MPILIFIIPLIAATIDQSDIKIPHKRNLITIHHNVKRIIPRDYGYITEPELSK